MYESPQLIPSTKKVGESLFSIVLEARMPKLRGLGDWRLRSGVDDLPSIWI